MLWCSRYETGVALVDEQHKELFRQLDTLLDHSKIDRAKSVVEFLGQYVIKHFADEEHLLARIGYPKLAAHKRLHADFIKNYMQLRKEFEASPGQESFYVMKLAQVVVRWLTDHIRVHDMEFADFYKKQQ